MNDYKKIRILHDIQENFTGIDKPLIDNMISQIENSNFKTNLERFYRGYKIEDYFSFLFPALPWVKLVHGLEETQLPENSKKNYQVPDYLLIYENCKIEDFPILIDVKNVKSDKITLDNIIKIQYKNIKKYSDVMKVPFLYAIYWEKMHTWTINSIEHFKEKTSKYKISFKDAFTNDLSVLFGDVTFFITNPIYRRTTCDSSIISKELPTHETYGTIISDEMSTDGKNWIKIEAFESAIIDSSIKMEIADVRQNATNTFITEKSDGRYALKLSSLILRHLSVFDIDLKPEAAQVSGHYIIQLMKKMNLIKSYIIPRLRNDDTDFFFKQAFEGSYVYRNYKDYHKL